MPTMRHFMRTFSPNQVVKPARLHFARAARALAGRYIHTHTCVGEAFCPNIQPRAHARLTGLTTNQAVLVAAREGLWLEQHTLFDFATGKVLPDFHSNRICCDEGLSRARRQMHKVRWLILALTCQTQSGLLPRSGSPAQGRNARQALTGARRARSLRKHLVRPSFVKPA